MRLMISKISRTTRGAIPATFIQHQQPGMGHERPSHDEHLQLTAAAIPARILRLGIRAGSNDKPSPDLPYRLSRTDGRADAQIFFNRQILKGLTSFQDLNDPLAGNLFRRLVVYTQAIIDDLAIRDFYRFQASEAEIAFSVVVFPDPFPPKRETICRSSTESETPLRTWITSE